MRKILKPIYLPKFLLLSFLNLLTRTTIIKIKRKQARGEQAWRDLEDGII